MKTPPTDIRSERSAQSGFSLIEVMIAMVVFAIGVLSLAICVPAGTHRVTDAGQQTHASELAAQRAEALLITPYGDDDLTAGSHTDANNPIDGNYYVKWSVTDDAPISQCKRIVVQVTRTSATAPVEAQVTIVSPESGG